MYTYQHIRVSFSHLQPSILTQRVRHSGRNCVLLLQRALLRLEYHAELLHRLLELALTPRRTAAAMGARALCNDEKWKGK